MTSIWGASSEAPVISAEEYPEYPAAKAESPTNPSLSQNCVVQADRVSYLVRLLVCEHNGGLMFGLANIYAGITSMNSEPQ